ncbi:MAG: hypothetical protein PHV37_07820 [Candidatus Gastranaerophilales bacterium]|nr:hypothetical protein [Candidatus Gastranaerophilales bacterium]
MKFGYKIAVWALTLTLTFLLPVNQAFSLEEATVKRAPMTIKDCINTALQNSPTVKKSRLNYNLAKTEVGISKTAPTSNYVNQEQTNQNLTACLRTKSTINKKLQTSIKKGTPTMRHLF